MAAGSSHVWWEQHHRKGDFPLQVNCRMRCLGESTFFVPTLLQISGKLLDASLFQLRRRIFRTLHYSQNIQPLTNQRHSRNHPLREARSPEVANQTASRHELNLAGQVGIRFLNRLPIGCENCEGPICQPTKMEICCFPALVFHRFLHSQS